MRRVSEALEGTFTLLALCADAPGAIVAARRSSPLVVGLGEDENFLGSDVLAFVEHTSRALEIDQDQQVLVTAKGVTIIGHDGSLMPHKEFEVDFASDRATKDGWATFMEKEIHEQPRVSPIPSLIVSILMGTSPSTRSASPSMFCAESTRSS